MHCYPCARVLVFILWGACANCNDDHVMVTCARMFQFSDRFRVFAKSVGYAAYGYCVVCLFLKHCACLYRVSVEFYLLLYNMFIITFGACVQTWYKIKIIKPLGYTKKSIHYDFPID